MTLLFDVIHGDEDVSLDDAISTQAEQCATLGSPLSHDVLTSLQAAVAPRGPLAAVLADRRTVRGGDLVGLRLLSAAHRLVLSRRAPKLAAFYPTVGGDVPTDARGREALNAALIQAFQANPQVVAQSLNRIPQTNETGRALPLRGALARVSAAHGQPIRLHELAASAGLNLRADAMPWAKVPIPTPVTISQRAGCDLNPLDVTKAEDRLTLASYVWGDDLPRFERLRSAFVLAQRIPAEVRQMSAGDYLTMLTHTEPTEGQTLVIWHSATWFYMERPARVAMRSAIRKLANRASSSAPVVHVSWEWKRDSPDASKSYALVGRSWPAAGAWAPWRPGTSVMLGTGSAHGMPMRWSEPKPLPSDPLEV